MKYLWIMVKGEPGAAERLGREAGVSPLLAQCLINRGFCELAAASSFLEPRLRELADPFQLPAMTEAVDRLYAARNAGETVVIYGDYYVDGVTSTALL